MRQKDEMERTENARARSNRHILWLTYGIAALFIAMAVYFGWFIQFKSENVIGSSYNARLDLLSDRVTRGSIMSNDKTVLAQTNVASDGSEKRYYPYDYLFVHSVGYSGKNGISFSSAPFTELSKPCESTTLKAEKPSVIPSPVNFT